MRKCRILSIIATALLAFLAGNLSAAAQSAKESEHNRKGLAYYNAAFYQHLPHGKQREADNSFELAITEFRQAITSNPNYADAHRNLARVYFVQKNFQQAADAYRTVTLLKPEDIDAFVLLALSYTEINKFPEAIEALQAAKTHTSDQGVVGKLDGYIEKIGERK